MKQIIIILLVFAALVSMTGCNYEPVERAEQPHLYWKTIDVVVEDVDQRHWFATVHRYELSITVYSEEYNLRKTLNWHGTGMYAPKYWDVKEGDVVQAELYSWVLDSTGEVTRREINNLK